MPDTVTRGARKKPRAKRRPRPYIYVELPDHFAHLKPGMERLARRHTRTVSGEVCVALLQYLEGHHALEQGGGGDE
jgi:hypothetical protein